MRPRLGLLAAALVLIGAPEAGADTIKFGTIAPKDSPYYDSFRDLGEAWSAATKGAINLHIYTNVGDEPDILRKLQIGQLQAAAISGGGLVEIVPELRVLQLPLYFRSEDERRYVAERVHPYLADLLVSRGVRPLCWSSTGWLNWFTKEPVVTPEDLRRLPIFVWGGDIGYSDAWRDAGYRPVALPVPEVIAGLQSGLIGALSVQPLAALSFQWFGVANHMTDIPWVPLDGAIIVSEPAWQDIDASARPSLEVAAREVCARLESAIDALNAKAVEVMKEYGLAVHAVPGDIADEWERTVATHYPKILGDAVPDNLLAMVEGLRDEYRAEHPVP